MKYLANHSKKSSKRVRIESRKGASRRRGIPYGIDARRRIAIGALERDVLTQFLVEAVVLSSFCGVGCLRYLLFDLR